MKQQLVRRIEAQSHTCIHCRLDSSIAVINKHSNVITGFLSSGVKRGDTCPCGSGKKFKKCCGVVCVYDEDEEFDW